MLRLTLLLLLLTLALPAGAQTRFRVMSYNVENLFDTADNPEKDDGDFLPSGLRRWTPKRYRHKLQQIARVITAAGQWDTPALVGLCEVENDSVLIHLLTRTPLRHQHYRYCLASGHDRRGIQVALLYQRDRFGYLGHEAKPIAYSGSRRKPSRSLLHVWGKLPTNDTLDVFVCHFPSRYGGEKESEADRLDAARTLDRLCDSLAHARTTARILVMGDLNDTPHDPSLRLLQASGLLHNLFATPPHPETPGSHKHQGTWSQIDHILVSHTLLDTHRRFHYLPQSAQIYAPSFLLTPDKTWHGSRPFRSYYGFRYEGGYSDHLPLIADFSY